MSNPIEANIGGNLSMDGRSIPGSHGHNEDSYYYNPQFSPNLALAMVLDGVGGEDKGELASSVARDALVAWFQRATHPRQNPPPLQIMANVAARTRSLISNFLETNPPSPPPAISRNDVSSALKYASKAVSEISPGSSTTATIAKFYHEGGQYYADFGSIGDSRVYLFREGLLALITEDDSRAFSSYSNRAVQLTEQLDAISSQQQLDQMDDDVKILFNNRFWISQALGQKRVTPHTYRVPLVEGDRVILTTDGVHDNLTRREIGTLASFRGNLPHLLTSQAYLRSRQSRKRSKPDDITALVIDVARSAQWAHTEPQLPVETSGLTPEESLYFDLSGGREIELEFEGKPIRIHLAQEVPDNLLEIVETSAAFPQDIRSQNAPGRLANRLLIQPKFFFDSHYQTGYRELTNNHLLTVGKRPTGRFQFGPTVSGDHFSVFRYNDRFVIRDLRSSEGTIVEI